MYDITKQPIWVQEEIASLERRLAAAEKQVAELLGEHVVQYGGDLDWDRPVGIEQTWQEIETLPQGTAVYFKQRRGYISIRQEGHDQNVLRIMSSGRPLVIKPEVSNVITVKQEVDS